MQDVFYITDVEQASALMNPLRIELLKQMDAPRTCPELAASFGETAQKIYYHVKALEKAGLVEKTAERRVRGAIEGLYQARARSYWLAPSLVGKVGTVKQARDQASLRVLLNLAEEIHDDVGQLGHQTEAGHDVPSLSLSAHIYLPDAGRRAAFLKDVQTAFQQIAAHYGLPEDSAAITDQQGFRLILVCYPKHPPTQQEKDA